MSEAIGRRSFSTDFVYLAMRLSSTMQRPFSLPLAAQLFLIVLKYFPFSWRWLDDYRIRTCTTCLERQCQRSDVVELVPLWMHASLLLFQIDEISIDDSLDVHDWSDMAVGGTARWWIISSQSLRNVNKWHIWTSYMNVYYENFDVIEWGNWGRWLSWSCTAWWEQGRVSRHFRLKMKQDEVALWSFIDCE